MTLIGRLLMRGAGAAAATGAAVMIALAPQPGVAITHTVDEHSGGTDVSTVHQAPSAPCTAARNAFIAALKADVSEDASERDLAKTGTNTNDPTEDQAERAALKPLISAMESACEPNEAGEQPTNRPAPSAACTSAKAALQAYFTQLRAQAKAEWTNHTEGTDADRTEDQAAFAQLKTLFQTAATACGFTAFDHDSR